MFPFFVRYALLVEPLVSPGIDDAGRSVVQASVQSRSSMICEVDTERDLILACVAGMHFSDGNDRGSYSPTAVVLSHLQMDELHAIRKGSTGVLANAAAE